MMCKTGIDMVAVLEAVGTSEKLLNPLRNSDAGYFALAYLCFKVASPFRCVDNLYKKVSIKSVVNK